MLPHFRWWIRKQGLWVLYCSYQFSSSPTYFSIHVLSTIANFWGKKCTHGHRSLFSLTVGSVGQLLIHGTLVGLMSPKSHQNCKYFFKRFVILFKIKGSGAEWQDDLMTRRQTMYDFLEEVGGFSKKCRTSRCSQQHCLIRFCRLELWFF